MAPSDFPEPVFQSSWESIKPLFISGIDSSTVNEVVADSLLLEQIYQQIVHVFVQEISSAGLIEFSPQKMPKISSGDK